MKKRNFILVLVLLMLFGGIFVIQDTLAKYYSKANKDQTIQVAKWDFDNENLSKDLTVDLQPTVDASSLVNNKVAPGTKGSFSIKLTNANTEYESGSDDKDTAAGKQALTMKVPVTIEGTQAKPSSTPVVSKIN